MRWSTCVFVLAALSAVTTGAHAAPGAVVELFTSQGCSSCPPADELFVKLARDPDLITLSLPVDYWDRLGWKDTLAKHAFTERQTVYAGTRGDGQIYTPQAVVNGVLHVVGSDRGAIDDAVTKTAGILTVPLSAQRIGDDIVVSVGSATRGGATDAMITVLPFLGSRDVAIGRGENARNKVTYTNVVRDIVPAGRWSGTPLVRALPASDYRQYDGLVVLLQAGTPERPGAILGATRIAVGSNTEPASPM
jgi:hypothetical protein